jgi:hypothetical protein
MWLTCPGSRFGLPLATVLSVCERAGLLATKADHHPHHVHDHPTVYQSFTSSGIFSRRLDTVVNGLWNSAVNACPRQDGIVPGAGNHAQKPFDVLLPQAVVAIALAVVLPIAGLAALEHTVGV